MSTLTSEAEDAGRLLFYALSRNRAMEAAHRELLRRYRTDGGFQGQVESFARGLGLRVLDVLDQGLVLAADSDSPFTFRLSDYRQNLTVEERLCHGLVHVAIAVWCFPTAAMLEDEDRALVKVAVQDVVEYLKAACQELQRRSTIDPDMGRPELQEAWRLVLARAETRETGDGRRAAHTLSGMVGWALDRLTQEGWLRKDSEERGGTWYVRPAYRVLVRELAAHEAFRLVSSIPPEAP
jgi:hypothetical protein